MANELTYTGIVTDGVLKITNRKQFDADLKSFEGQRVVFKIKKYKAKRSLEQNGYYHSGVIPAVRQGLIDLGFERHVCTNEAVHELLKDKFLKVDIANEQGEYISLARSTTDLNKSEFGDFIDAINRWAIDFLGFSIPPPSTQTKINY